MGRTILGLVWVTWYVVIVLPVANQKQPGEVWREVLGSTTLVIVAGCWEAKA